MVWTCPFCGQTAQIPYTNILERAYEFDHNSKYGAQALTISLMVCINPNCKEFTLKASLSRGPSSLRKEVHSWQLNPASEAKSFPDYIPNAILKDYEEACLIRDLSPKASATLSRRCLQGMIRDFWDVKKPRLIDEIESIKDRVAPLTWAAIDAVRQIGNIAAHMEKDINDIIDVDPKEAGILISLVETLIKDWYILRHDREQQLRGIVQLSDQKKTLKTGTDAKIK